MTRIALLFTISGVSSQNINMFKLFDFVIMWLQNVTGGMPNHNGAEQVLSDPRQQAHVTDQARFQQTVSE